MSSLAIPIATLALIFSPQLAPPAESSPPEPTLLPGESTVEAPLPPGKTLRYRLAASAEPIGIVVEQVGIDVEVLVRNAEGEELLAVDNPLDRFGEELSLVPAGDDLRLEIRSRDPLAPAGRVRVRWIPISAEEQPAWEVVTAAGTAYRRQTSEAWIQAREAHRRAVPLWQQVGDRSEGTWRRARSLYAAAVLSRLLDDTAVARELGEAALAAYGVFASLEAVRWQGYTRVELGLVRWMEGQSGTAVGQFATALQQFEALGDGYGEAVVRHNLCLMHLVAGDLRAGRRCYEADREVIEAAGSAEMTGAASTNLGRASDLLGEPQEALEAYGRALEALRAAGDELGEARTLNNLGVLQRALGQTGEAVASYGRALEIFRRRSDRRWQARVLNNLGAAHLSVGDTRQAEAGFEAALALWRQAGDQVGEASSLSNLGAVAEERGEPARALEFHRWALDLRRALGDEGGETRSLARLARAQVAAGETAAATVSFQLAIEGARRVGDRSQEALALLHQGRLRVNKGALAGAVESLTAAAALSRELGYRAREALALEWLARAEAARGDGVMALAHTRRAMTILDDLRVEIHDPDLGVAFSRSRHTAYALAVDLLMAEHRRDPSGGFDRQALEATERARARTLLAVLAEAGARIEGGVEPELAQRRQRLLQRLSAKTERMLAPAADEAERPTLERERLEVLRELDLVEADLRAANPTFAALTAPRPVGAEAMQALLTEDTVLLSYFLGEERSFLWRVDTDSVASAELPPRHRLEALARRVHGNLSSLNLEEWRAEAAALGELGETLMQPLLESGATGLPPRRLVIVADGALRYLPFGALPWSPVGQTGDPLVHHSEIVYLPSASALAAMRREEGQRPPPAARLAVLADPVFGPDDPRVREGREGAVAGTRDRGEEFVRLPASRQEAEAILALAATEDALALYGFAADRQAVLEGRLEPYRVVHFATHGVLDAAQPALSGLVLSRVDEEGTPRAGFLGLHDIYSLKLRAELVVLSGCRTALGEEMRGEGLVGLTRGFLYAGTPRVVASLWPVEDRATARLMEYFYRALWQEGRPAAAALRQAQIRLRQERRWRDPYFWAGFLLQGEWR